MSDSEQRTECDDDGGVLIFPLDYEAFHASVERAVRRGDRSASTIPALTLSQCIERALHELQEVLQSRHLTDYVDSRIRRAIMLLRGEAVP